MRAVFDDLTLELLSFIAIVCIFCGTFFYMYISAINQTMIFNRNEIILQHAHITSAYCREIDAGHNSIYMFTDRFDPNTRKITA